jgi:hypothetical protein
MHSGGPDFCVCRADKVIFKPAVNLSAGIGDLY